MIFMKENRFIFFLLFTQIILYCHAAKKSSTQTLLEKISDAKDLKKLCRTKNNVLVVFLKNNRETADVLDVFNSAAENVKGQATIATVDCSSEGKKFCRKLKVTPEPYVIKHYKDGEFHKEYDRKIIVQSIVNFLRDPTGDLPWEEDDNAKDVVHLADSNGLGKLIKKNSRPIMIMFYAPWCGYCKKMKPEYQAAAVELKGHSVLAAMDVNKPENSGVRQYFNVTGFPTLLYFEKGQVLYRYEGENNKESLVKFMKNPEVQPEKPKEEVWADTPSDVVHLTDENFASTLESEPSILVMFYAPWCGHCKKMKPEYIEAAAIMKEDKIPGILAAVDATEEKNIGDKFKINGYPTVKYFRNGEFAFDVSVRKADKIIEFMLDPKEPPPPPPPEKQWSEEESQVVHLTDEDFKPFLKRKKHVLVMFYAPWCGHCKKAKPEFTAAADHFKDDSKVEFAAVDCTAHSSICSAVSVSGYPTLLYFSYYKTEKPYEGDRTKKGFVDFMESTVSGIPPPPPPPPDSWWLELPGGENVLYLNDGNFDGRMKSEESALVMFYAPWCGHCKAMKPAFAEAATELKKKKINGVLVAVDATIETSISNLYSIKGFPTLKYFRNGNFVADYDKGRTVEDLVRFMKNPSLPKEEL